MKLYGKEIKGITDYFQTSMDLTRYAQGWRKFYLEIYPSCIMIKLVNTSIESTDKGAVSILEKRGRHFITRTFDLLIPSRAVLDTFGIGKVERSLVIYLEQCIESYHGDYLIDLYSYSEVKSYYYEMGGI